MIKFITGAKGTGKTKNIIDMANDNIDTAKGDNPVSEEALIGFIKGLLAGNHDIETLYIDGAHRMLGKTVHEMKDFFDDIREVAKDTDTQFVITVSEDENNLPDFVR